MHHYRLVLIALLTLSLSGCNLVGPRTIHTAGLNYNEAVAGSRDEQLLLNLVRLKYRDSPLFLEITSVSTQYNMSYSLAGEAGFLDSNKRVLSSGINFVEKPIIQYAPLQGNKFVTQILTPIPIDNLVLLSRSGWSIERVLRLCVQDMHGLKNAPTASGPTPLDEPEYEDFAEATRLLQQMRGDTEIGIASEDDQHKLLVRLPGHPEDRESISQLQRLLDLSPSQTTLTFNAGFGPEQSGDLSIQTRSLMGVMYYLSQNVQAPERHEAQGRVTVTRTSTGEAFDWGDVLSDIFTVKSRLIEPGNAAVKVHYRGVWFYIDDVDLASKTTFALLSQLFSLQAGDIATYSPALTISLGN